MSWASCGFACQYTVGFVPQFELRRWEREEGTARHRIVAVTAHARLDDRKECLMADKDDMITKLFSVDDLLHMINQNTVSEAD